MQRIAIVTDSTADIPTELAADWGITVIPLLSTSAVSNLRTASISAVTSSIPN